MYVYGACLFYVCCKDCVGSVGMFVVIHVERAIQIEDLLCRQISQVLSVYIPHCS